MMMRLWNSVNYKFPIVPDIIPYVVREVKIVIRVVHVTVPLDLDNQIAL